MTGQPVRDDPGHHCSMQGLGQDAEHDVEAAAPTMRPERALAAGHSLLA